MSAEEINAENQKLWNEMAAERGGETTEAAVEPLTVETPAEEKVAEGVTEPVVETTPVVDTAPVNPLAEQLAAMEHRLKSAEGRIGATQKVLQDQLDAAKQAATTVKEAPTQAAVKEAITDPEQWANLKNDFPEWATATEALLDVRLSNIGGIDPAAIQAMVSEQVKGQTNAMRAESIDSALDAVFPGWKDTVKGDDYAAWIVLQPDDVKALADSSKVGDAATLLRKFEASKAPSVTQTITQERHNKLEAAASAPQKTTGKVAQPKSVEDMTPAELWDYEAKQRAKKRQPL